MTRSAGVCVRCGTLDAAAITYTREQMWHAVAPGEGQDGVGRRHRICNEHRQFHWNRGEDSKLAGEEMLLLQATPSQISRKILAMTRSCSNWHES